MDITTILGFVAMAGLLVLGVFTGQLPSFFLNWHGLGIVLGGSFAAMLVNTPGWQIRGALSAFFVALRGGHGTNTEKLITSIVSLAEQVRARGISALQGAGGNEADGFLAKAAAVAIEYNNADLVEEILINDINTTFDRNNEITNVYRTLSVLAPMFGLLGTLIGIVSVLKEISNPENVGKAMAVAMTTAFYGISLANMICVPVAGKLRSRNLEQLRVRSMAADGIVMMLRGSVPLAIERKLRSYR